jgi:alpha-tubulin suppressor-like RCC1 family protein
MAQLAPCRLDFIARKGPQPEDRSAGWLGRAPAFAAVACGGGHTVAVTRAGRLFSWGSNACGQLGLPPDTPEAAAPTEVRPAARAANAVTDKVKFTGLTHNSQVDPAV